MVELSLFLSIIAITLPICVTGVLIAKIYLKNTTLDPKITQKIEKHRQQYIEIIEKKNLSLKNKLNSMQKGPQLSEIGDLEGVLPELIGQMENILPKWATKLIKSNPDIINTVVKYAKDNPDKAKELIGRFVKNKAQTSGVDQTALPGL